MNTKDITEREFETLGLIRDLKEFIKDKPQFDDLDDAVRALIDGESIDEDEFIEDVNMLAKNGFIRANAVYDKIPVVKDITMQGMEMLAYPQIVNEISKNIPEQQMTEKQTLEINSEQKNNFTFNFNLNVDDLTLFKGGDVSLWKPFSKQFQAFGKIIKFIGESFGSEE